MSNLDIATNLSQSALEKENKASFANATSDTFGSKGASCKFSYPISGAVAEKHKPDVLGRLRRSPPARPPPSPCPTKNEGQVRTPSFHHSSGILMAKVLPSHGCNAAGPLPSHEVPECPPGLLAPPSPPYLEPPTMDPPEFPTPTKTAPSAPSDISSPPLAFCYYPDPANKGRTPSTSVHPPSPPYHQEHRHSTTQCRPYNTPTHISTTRLASQFVGSNVPKHQFSFGAITDSPSMEKSLFSSAISPTPSSKQRGAIPRHTPPATVAPTEQITPAMPYRFSFRYGEAS